MTQIEPATLWLGHVDEGRDFRKLFDIGIKALVQLALEEPPSVTPREMIYLRFPLSDGAGNQPETLFLAIVSLSNLLRMNIPTLVSCSGGVNRSPAIAAAALSLVHKEAPEGWLQKVAEKHRIDVSPGLWKEITAVLADSK